MLDDLIIYQKTYDFLLWLHPVVNKFPQSERFIMRQRIEHKTLDILHSIMVANAERDELRMLVRLAKDLRFMNVRQYVNRQAVPQEIAAVCMKRWCAMGR